jgi:uncharacterized phage-associated protein
MAMEQEMFPIRVRTRYTSGLVQSLKDWLKKETDVDYPREAVQAALTDWIETRYDRMIESLPEVLTSPELAEAQEFRRILEAHHRPSPAFASSAAAESALETSTVFTGSRPFAKEKLAAMIAYMAEHGKNIYKTNLNKLLFYSDLTAYYLNGRGISGATYLNLPYGPVPDKVDTVIDELADAGAVSRIAVPEFGAASQRIMSKGQSARESLTDEEQRILSWVLENYGDMSPSEITEYSHAEKAYKFTRPHEPIAYEYAKFFKKLPPREL